MSEANDACCSDHSVARLSPWFFYSHAITAARSKKDIGAAAKAAIALGNDLTDFAYAWNNTERVVAPKTAPGAPATRPTDGKVFEEKPGGRSI